MTRVFVDGGYSDGRISSAAVILNREVVVKRVAISSEGDDSFIAELKAIELGCKMAKDYPIVKIYSDAMWMDEYLKGVLVSEKYNVEIKLLRDAISIAGLEIVWIPRAKNKLADGLATAELRGLDWRTERSIGMTLPPPIPLLTPGNFLSEGEIVNKKAGRWYCSCEVSKDLAVLGLHCRHVTATKKALNEITRLGELE